MLKELTIIMESECAFRNSNDEDIVIIETNYLRNGRWEYNDIPKDLVVLLQPILKEYTDESIIGISIDSVNLVKL